MRPGAFVLVHHYATLGRLVQFPDSSLFARTTVPPLGLANNSKNFRTEVELLHKLLLARVGDDPTDRLRFATSLLKDPQLPDCEIVYEPMYRQFSLHNGFPHRRMLFEHIDRLVDVEFSDTCGACILACQCVQLGPMPPAQSALRQLPFFNIIATYAKGVLALVEGATTYLASRPGQHLTDLPMRPRTLCAHRQPPCPP